MASDRVRQLASQLVSPNETLSSNPNIPTVLRKFDMTGKVAVVTGGSRGLGKEMVLAFAQCGCDVVIASRKRENCIALAKEVETMGRRALPVGFNANSWEDCNKLYEETYRVFGKCDVLVNNAGGSPLYPSLVEHTEALYDKVLALNLKGPFRLSALFATRMAKEGGGSVINISSTASQRASPVESFQNIDQLPYGMAKAGLNMMTIGMAKAFGPKVRVNVIVPGPFLTDISKAWDLDAFNKRAQASIPLGRGGQADEIVGAALLLATDAGSYITGAILNVDGGPSKIALGYRAISETEEEQTDLSTLFQLTGPEEAEGQDIAMTDYEPLVNSNDADVMDGGVPDWKLPLLNFASLGMQFA
ncbi:hypothetical protein HDU93_007935 [Gonapodya sp. JEL0774]|nr:hypothetical protein HDU93_007935 [Gonapodya sp. JEL0774]